MCHHESLETLKTEMAATFQSFKKGQYDGREAVQLRLADSYGQPFSVHMFVAVVAPQEEDPDRPCAIIGICEQYNRKSKDRYISESGSGTSGPTRRRTPNHVRRAPVPASGTTARLSASRTQIPVSDPGVAATSSSRVLAGRASLGLSPDSSAS
eukprot:TRINITY_DN12685_c0_g1_i2.p1 TRINITY_DN12685_c0_g1~~TRINITY_DN12685_c0_g1_i2.p1  ORF type:complete len:154 (+),score=12.25 TRINITY_DN12685_c0_g1_i2:654-1115(+)